MSRAVERELHLQKENDMKISTDGVHWVGTFDRVLGFLLDDLLHEGPITATVTVIDGDAEVDIRGEVTLAFPGYIVLKEGINAHEIPRDRIIGLEV
jgi:sugar lactone lactonase YvrE